ARRVDRVQAESAGLTAAARPDGLAMDWNVAVATARRLLRSGPEVPRAEADKAVRDLRRFSVEAETRVRWVTGLGSDLPIVEGDVLDRVGWVRAAAQGLSSLTEAAAASADMRSMHSTELLSGLSARTSGVQTGLVLGYL